MPVATVTAVPFVGKDPAENPNVKTSLATDAVKLGSVPTPLIGVTLAVFTAPKQMAWKLNLSVYMMHLQSP